MPAALTVFPSTDFIEACNLLHLKATISCERKLVFDKVQKTTTFTAKVEPSQVTITAQSNLDALIDDLETEENVEYHLKQEESGQILEVYEISNIEDADMTYETNEENEDEGEEQYELLNVTTDSKNELLFAHQTEKAKKLKPQSMSDIKPRTPARIVDEEIMDKAIKEIFSNSSRSVTNPPRLR